MARRGRKRKKQPLNQQQRNMPFARHARSLDLHITDYVFRFGLRFVKPYFFTHYANAKGRWCAAPRQRPLSARGPPASRRRFKRSVLDVFTTEFRGQNEAFYVGARPAARGGGAADGAGCSGTRSRAGACASTTRWWTLPSASSAAT